MTEIEPQFLEVVSTSAQELRSTFSIFQPGVFAAGDLKVTAGSGLTVDVASGIGFVRGSNITDQGNYRVRNDATKNSSAFDVAGIPSNSSGFPRIDQVIARLLDQTHDSSGLRKWRLEYVAGTGTSGATLDNRTGAVSDVGLGNNWLRLADALIPSGAVSVLAANIRDRRSFARGAKRKINRTAGDYALSSATLAAIDSTNLSPRIECMGLPMAVGMYVQTEHSAAVLSRFVPRVDGVVPAELGTGGEWAWDPGANRLSGTSIIWEFTPTVGSHLISLAYRTGAATLTMRANATNALQMTLREFVSQDAENT